MQLIVLPFLSAFVFNSVTASLDIDKQSGFDCGRVFFGEKVIRNAGSLVSRNLKRSSQISLVDDNSFHGRNPNHVPWPIRESGQIYGLSRSRENFYILVDSSGKVKDVMARLSNDDFTRCSRKNSRRKSLSLDTSNGYRCGQNFFGDEQLRGDVDEAISKLGQGLKYPVPYKGNLYPGHKYLTWPILNEKKNNSSQWEHSSFHVILSRDGKIIDVVAKLKCNDFIKCERATKLLRGRSVESPRLQRRAGVEQPSDYLCDSQYTYKHDYLSFSMNQALIKVFSTEQELYPMKHNQYPCLDNPCNLWPVLPNGILYANGRRIGKHFLIFRPQSKMIGVFSLGPNGMVPCTKVPSTSQASTSGQNAVGGNYGRLSPQRNHRGEFIARPGTQPPNFFTKGQNLQR